MGIHRTLSVYIGIIIAVIIPFWLYFLREKKEKIKDFIDKFQERYRPGDEILPHLIPSGILNLKKEKNYKIALIKLNNLGLHPLRQWEDRVKKIGYKKFFEHVHSSGRTFNKDTIESFLDELEND